MTKPIAKVVNDRVNVGQGMLLQDLEHKGASFHKGDKELPIRFQSKCKKAEWLVSAPALGLPDQHVRTMVARALQYGMFRNDSASIQQSLLLPPLREESFGLQELLNRSQASSHTSKGASIRVNDIDGSWSNRGR